MTRRRKLLAGGLAVAAIAVALSLPAVRWRLVGWWRGEAFYRGRPTSFYRPLCHRENLPPACSYLSVGLPDKWPWIRTVMGDRVADWLVEDPNPLLDCGPDAVPVLVALLDDPDWEVRVVAVWYLGNMRPPAKDALPALRRLRANWGTDRMWNPACVDDCIASIELATPAERTP